MTKEELESARQQLHELAKKLGVSVGACGCCNSPFLFAWPCKVGDGQPVLEDVVIGGHDDE